jgi:aspartokinase-like uncharacterized kinase
MTSHSSVVVVKLGGSLFDLPGLGCHLSHYLDQLAAPVLLVPGGGLLVETLRDLDRKHSFGDEASHWLSLRAMSINAHMTSKLIDGSVVVQNVSGCSDRWSVGSVAILDAFEFARRDEGNPGCLPHSWAVTSDSVAARVAVVSGATELILLKSVDWRSDGDWQAAQQQGVVDGYFKNAVTPRVPVRVVNFRRWMQERPEP